MTESECTNFYELVVQMNTGESYKRVEENLKFIFKLSFRHLKKNFEKSRSFLGFSKRSEELFYRFYFERESKERGIPLKEFFDPLNYVVDSKTINQSYLRRVLSVYGFRSDLLKYIKSGEFKRDYQRSIRSKLNKLLGRFDSLFECQEDLEKKNYSTRVKRYFRRNKQCKLPWSEREIEKSLSDFLSFVSND